MTDSIQSVRKAARELVRELHLLDGRVECCGLPLSQCHLVVELDQLGKTTASDLAEKLVLEKSTMSRLVNTLVDKGLVCAACCEDDRRSRILCLTDAGREQARLLDENARQQVKSALEYVSPGNEQLVLEGMARYAKALRYARISSENTIRLIDQKDNAAVASIIREVMKEFDAVGEGFSINDPEVDAMSKHYPAPNAAFYVVDSPNGILGCGGMGPLRGGNREICELRKMYFLPELRGTGMGTKLLRVILDAAREAGFTQCYLESIKAMDKARKLYTEFGFTPLDQPLGNTGHSACNQQMILNLTDDVE